MQLTPEEKKMRASFKRGAWEAYAGFYASGGAVPRGGSHDIAEG